jgi:hypothetical protein
MMQALPPPALPASCARSVEDVSSLISVSGAPAQIASFVALLKKYPQIRQEGDIGQGKGVQLLVLRAPGSLPYRDIGGLIYSAQTLGLALAFTPSMPLCDSEAN